jgi:mycothiol synthase
MTTSSTPRRLELEGAPLIAGLRARSFGDPDDYERLSELMTAANTLDAIPYLPTAEGLQVEWDAADGADPIDDVVIAEVDGRLIAASGVERVVRADVPTYELWGAVDPALRRLGLGTWLMGWALEHARVRASREDPGTPVDLGAFAEDREAGHRALLEATGFEAIRHFFLMRRHDLDDVPDTPLPEGLEIRPVTEDQRRAILDAENEAFRDHWGHREMGDSAYQATFARPELDTDLWVVAWDGDQVAGVVQNWIWPKENEKLGVKRAWLEHISVRRPWRRRGLARAITAASLVKLREAGLDEAMLGVDSENPNGALGLYERLGFETESRAAAYRRDLRSKA